MVLPEKCWKNAEWLIHRNIHYNMMGRLTVSSCHSLSLIEISRLTRFARVGLRVILSMPVCADDALAVPGSIKMSSTSDNGVTKKKITFERADVSMESARELDRLRFSRLVALYVDELGRRRVAGSPNWPLSLDYSTGEGVFTVTLQGEDTDIDGFLMD